VIVFMTDGQCNLGKDPGDSSCFETAFKVAQDLKLPSGLNTDIYTVAFTKHITPVTDQYSLNGFMNAISSSGCYQGIIMVRMKLPPVY